MHAHHDHVALLLRGDPQNLPIRLAARYDFARRSMHVGASGEHFVKPLPTSGLRELPVVLFVWHGDDDRFESRHDSSTCMTVSSALACSAKEAAYESAWSDEAEKSVGQRMRVKSRLAKTRSGPRRRGTVSTGQGARRRIRSVTDPSISRSKPDRPCVPITMMSAGSSAATCTISDATFPVTTMTSTGTPSLCCSTNCLVCARNCSRSSGVNTIGG